MSALIAFGLALAMTPVAKPTTPDLTLPLAIDLARAALEVCAARGYPASASVVDAQGLALVILRHPDSVKPPVAAPRKAATAALFDAPGGAMEPRAKTDAAFAARIAAEPERLNPHGGSLPLHVGDRLVGGLAVADAPHDIADQCARAALARFADHLH
ncbi:MAG: heme-binding protein [Alphaproteobacteria bacterium]|nr:heme-binding protein [Alphaproteobacteria bacterium]